VKHCPDERLRRDCERVLLQPESREVYDRNFHLLQKIAHLRQALGLRSTHSWDEDLQREFAPRSGTKHTGSPRTPGKRTAGRGAASKRTTGSKTTAWSAVALVAMLVALGGVFWHLDSSRAAYQRALDRDSIHAYSEFLEEHGDSEYAEEISERRDELAAAAEWDEIDHRVSSYRDRLLGGSGSQREVTRGLRRIAEEYPETETGERASETLEEMRESFARQLDDPERAIQFFSLFPDSTAADRVFARLDRWAAHSNHSSDLERIHTFLSREELPGISHRQIARTRAILERRRVEAAFEEAEKAGTEDAWEQFLDRYPDTDLRAEAERELAQLIRRYEDFSFVRSLDTREAYERFLRLRPDGREADLARKRLVDLEVDEILEGDVGEMPPLQPQEYATNQRRAEIRIGNDTDSALTVRYSGPDSQKHVIEPNRSRSIQIEKGDYRVTATVDRGGVRPYAGRETIRYDGYSVSFYIVTEPF